MPTGGDRRLRHEAFDVSTLGLAHVAARGAFIDGHFLGIERLDQRLDGRHASEIDHRAGPIEDD